MNPIIESILITCMSMICGAGVTWITIWLFARWLRGTLNYPVDHAFLEDAPNEPNKDKVRR